MSSRHSGSTFASSMASEEVYPGPMPIVSLLEDVDACANRVFDKAASTLRKFQTIEQLKSDCGQQADLTKLGRREVLLTSFLRRIEEARKDLSNMRRADFAALSLVWGNGEGLIGQTVRDTITMLADIEHQMLFLRDSLDTRGQAEFGPSQSETPDELLDRHMSLMAAESSDQGVRYRRDIHPCPGGLQLIKGEDQGEIHRCLRKDLIDAETERLGRGGTQGTYLFWKCDSCAYRLKYFASKSRATSLLSNDDDMTFKESKIRCSRAFLAMSHLEKREIKRGSNSHAAPKYTCMICVLHRPAARTGLTHVFSTRDDYAKHLEDTHIDGTPTPAFVLQKLGIEHGDRLRDGNARHLWIG